MIKVTLVIREIGKLEPDYSLEFNLPGVPAVGDYISIHRPDKPEPFSEDVIARKIWWRLNHPETGGIASSPPKIGSVHEIMVECDPAIGPYATDHWRTMAAAAAKRGITVEEFEVERFSVREKDLRGE
ncbi:hypothetical protein AncyloWKF20_09525 [Ancylobacter sp. WKF20]|uniref:hypothetical protein n=1 Tax=Ancylobacter sp. WKF20 TaxID=3039801 RepID=UPI002434535D|nr:hypothetical protein [Ancylobacter sp. WKF20]WGD32032.1 hypothetical protein AncyloWKF20_09525 [Ancylobacter sp. WKF20]